MEDGRYPGRGLGHARDRVIASVIASREGIAETSKGLTARWLGLDCRCYAGHDGRVACIKHGLVVKCTFRHLARLIGRYAEVRQRM
jgi:hypothetical protein